MRRRPARAERATERQTLRVAQEVEPVGAIACAAGAPASPVLAEEQPHNALLLIALTTVRIG